MKNILFSFVIISLLAAFSSLAGAKEYPLVLDAQFNSDVDFSKLDFSSVTLFTFDKTISCSDDVIPNLQKALQDVLVSKGITVNQLTAEKVLNENKDFSLEGTGDKGKRQIFEKATTDLVMSGTLKKAEVLVKRYGKSYVFYDIELYIYSRSLDKIIYRANYQHGKRMGNWKGTFSESFSDILKPVFEKISGQK